MNKIIALGIIVAFGISLGAFATTSNLNIIQPADAQCLSPNPNSAKCFSPGAGGTLPPGQGGIPPGQAKKIP